MLLLALLLASGGEARTPQAHASAKAIQTGSGPYNAAIRRTAHGIPHIFARDFPSARLRLRLRVRPGQPLHDRRHLRDGRRASARATSAPTTGWRFQGNGVDRQQPQLRLLLPADQRHRGRREAARAAAAARADARDQAGRARLRGRLQPYLRETGVDKLPDPRCRGKAWVRPIDEMDVYRRFYQLALAGQPGRRDRRDRRRRSRSPARAPATSAALELRRAGRRPAAGRSGSNAYGLGKDATDNGRGMVLGNPHFPWQGPSASTSRSSRSPASSTSPGGSLYGVPLVLIGHTRGLAWSHTVSTALPLHAVRADARAGLADLLPRTTARSSRWRPTAVTVKVGATAGSGPHAARSTRTELRARVHLAARAAAVPVDAGQRLRAWATRTRATSATSTTSSTSTGPERAPARRDRAPLPGHPLGQHDRGRLQGRGLLRRHRRHPERVQRQGRARATRVLGHATRPLLGLPIARRLALRRASWDNDPDAVGAGHLRARRTCPACSATTTSRTPTTATGCRTPSGRSRASPRIIGDERTTRTLRTRLGPEAAGRRRRASSRSTSSADTVFNDRQYAGELLARRAGRAVPRQPDAAGSSGPVDVSAACPVLEKWDRNDDLDSRARSCSAASPRARSATRPGCRSGCPARPGRLQRPFDAADPVNTPRGLNTGNPQVRPGAGRRGRGAARLRHPARRARCATTSTTRAAARRSRSTAARAGSACSTRSTCTWSPARATRTCRTARASSWPCSSRAAARSRARSSPTRSR